MLENKIEDHWHETIRGFLLKPDTDGPGRILQRYLNNGIIKFDDYNSNKDCRSVVVVDREITHDIVIDRPILLRFLKDFNHTLYIKSERVFVDSNNAFIKKVEIITDDECYCDTCDVLTKIMVADCIIESLNAENIKNLMLVNCTINNLKFDKTSNFMRLDT